MHAQTCLILLTCMDQKAQIGPPEYRVFQQEYQSGCTLIRRSSTQIKPQSLALLTADFYH